VHGGFLSEPARTLSEEGLASCSAEVLPAGAVVLTSRAPIGNVAMTDRPAATNQGCKSLVPTAETASRFVAYAARALLADIQVAGTGTTFQEVSGDRLGGVRFPKPPCERQRTIADFLDRECDRIAVALAYCDAPVVTVSRLPTQRLLEAIAALGARDERLRFGMMSLSQGWSPECWDRERGVDEWGVLKLGCVNGGVFTPDHKTLPPDVGPQPELEVLVGDLLMSRANTRSLVGSAAVVSPDVGPRLMLSDLLYRLRLDPDRWHPPYVAAVLNSPVGRTQLEAAASGSAGSMPKISQEVIRQLRLPRPGVYEQRIAADAFRDDDDRVRDLAAIADRVRAALTACRSSLIHEAVTGKLDVTAASDRQMNERLHAAAEGRLDEVPV
jgi:type I restriction enzyme S subunit